MKTTSSSISGEVLEIRKLTFEVKHELCRLLDYEDSWKEVMAIVHKDCDPSKDLKYSVQDLECIASYALNNRSKGCAATFLDEWGTSGRKRPTVKNLVYYLELANLHRAAHYIRQTVLKEQMELDQNTFKFLDSKIELIKLKNEEPVDFSYCDLEQATRFFNTQPHNEGGNLLGEGEFSTIYYGRLHGQDIAVKKLQKYEQYDTEKKTLSECKHENIIKLIGFSESNAIENVFCIVYSFMSNGSLMDRLSCLNNTPPLSVPVRCKIAQGVAKALQYLHLLAHPIVHRDVKSANILLDHDFKPKLSDFDVAKISDKPEVTTIFTETVSGTRFYMPPEAFNGIYSIKTDVFSFGIVVLELLTGREPYDEAKEKTLYYMIKEGDVELRNILDTKVSWDQMTRDILIQIATERCCMSNPEHRADIQLIVNELENVHHS